MTQDYRPTIFLPQTDFPMKGNLPESEPKILKRWEEMDLYHYLQKRAEGREKFILHDGPPFANGDIHLGHALNKILKDIVMKSQYKLGKATPFIPGWDCHGLPIEAKIEEKYHKEGKNKDDISRLQFRNECRKFAQGWIAVQLREFKRLGVIADWEHPYTTMTPEAEAEIIRLFSVFLMNGSLYHGVKPVLWSVVEKTALADMEVEYYDVESPSIYVRFPIHKTNLPVLKGASAVIWTTTPWTLPGNRAVAYGGELEYVALKVEEIKDDSLAKVGEVILIAKNLKEAVEVAVGIEKSTILEEFQGAKLEGTCAYHPFHGDGYDFAVPLLPAIHVTLEAGTGLVHTAPGHGVEDFALGQEFELEVPQTVGEDGIFYDHVPLFFGKHVYKVAPDVIAKLEEKGSLLRHSKIQHSYPHSWRSKKPLIYRTTPQWFISLDKKGLREKALEAINTVKWIPEAGKKRIQAMIQNRPDWCVSRQRAWGVPLTLFVNKKTGDVLRDYAVVERIIQAVQEEGSDVWYTANPTRFLGEQYNPDDYEQTQDIIDVWFDSASSQSFVLRLRPEMQWPADLYLEGSDQHRGWFQSSLMVSCGAYRAAPYKEVMTHGFIVDEEGKKMSKSRGDAVSPQVITETLGADILRLWVVNSDYYEDLRVGDEILKRQQDIYRRYRNTFRYLLGALSGFSAKEKVPYEQMPELEKWVLHRLYEIDQMVREASKSYDFQSLYAEIHNFCAVHLSAFYFDVRKDSLYCDDPKDIKRRATRTVMNSVFECLVNWLSPVLCFTAEEAWLSRYPDQKGSIHAEVFPSLPFEWNAPELAKKYEGLREIRKVMTGALEMARAAKHIGSSLQAQVEVFLSPSYKSAIEGVDLAELSITSRATAIDTHTIPENGFQLDEVPNVAVLVNPAFGNKCARCWKILSEVGENTAHPNLCERCVTVLEHA
ncbi:MAG: hypothetical protein ACD_16C00082G0008 [uncultured bacterium]|nr:MAG: hypothetical protein ACD_16C00082G0008 [uncultured bacterium]OFW69394.1 MAG: isoleucine--tRNA ligase [Alphaproteobacteria bacterium GWC2_42_16]OFW74153.1 MAG: isoleucine--tRNA ligase [Alphaproteobacteria bacterium GWA2_41_27]OFW84148.1 MAG: isoleucine--tRNA ligase [Alphaproteobacteria bacterium RIFCSPHIGHO2_12_FULL_42_100]OFW84759.1 MAG: isoleucine--tRNA ligase [Alphaproteobacteria bacterium RBG_16_42_14]OFW90887.1 MAG: isoleucine--tRNA ligase [Alphaproteobacteria bacterium RIFCSPHIGHO